MKLKLLIEEKELHDIKYFVKNNSDNLIFKERENNIINKDSININKDTIWKCMIDCLLTTQQKSSPGKPIYRFSNMDPFPLNFQICKSQKNIFEFSKKVIQDFKGIRRSINIAKAIDLNLNFLENNNGWDKTYSVINELKISNNKMQERNSIEKLMGKQKGFHQFGPKQIRNFFQMLGLVKYEIPIDSRIIKWLNKNHFPLKISGNALGDVNFYHFVLDILQEICEKINVLPTLLDAAIFTNADPPGSWK